MKDNCKSDKSFNNASPAFHMSRIADGSAALALTYEVLFRQGEEQGDEVISSGESRGPDAMRGWG